MLLFRLDNLHQNKTGLLHKPGGILSNSLLLHPYNGLSHYNLLLISIVKMGYTPTWGSEQRSGASSGARIRGYKNNRRGLHE